MEHTFSPLMYTHFFFLIKRKVYEALSNAFLVCQPGEGHIPCVTEC